MGVPQRRLRVGQLIRSSCAFVGRAKGKWEMGLRFTVYGLRHSYELTSIESNERHLPEYT